MRGPGTRPAAIASRSATSAKSRLPRSRTVVKPGEQRLACVRDALDRGARRRLREILVRRLFLPAREVHVRVDQARQQRHVAEIDVDGLTGTAGPDRDDRPAFDADHLPGQHATGLDLEQARRRHGERLRAGERRVREAYKNEKDDPHQFAPLPAYVQKRAF